ncbi:MULTISPECIES: DUF4179 domain-containing protein [Acinetobacter]|uniref:DUF4179 domain-containing protein n=1 Tax=Acinetobacter TaxID=469 RepID=UPI0014903858|nr:MULTISPECIES: DUF4179 domain-containing protein [Acinetobacter]NNP72510.1 peptide signal protein [Acinetobacter defluvii]
MNLQMIKLFTLSLTLGLGMQVTQAAAITKSQATVAPSQVMTEKLSPIEKALNQQKREGNKVLSNPDDLKVFTSLKSTASQNFLAEQHQRFSRLVQAIFQPHSS